MAIFKCSICGETYDSDQMVIYIKAPPEGTCPISPGPCPKTTEERASAFKQQFLKGEIEEMANIYKDLQGNCNGVGIGKTEYEAYCLVLYFETEPEYKIAGDYRTIPVRYEIIGVATAY